MADSKSKSWGHTVGPLPAGETCSGRGIKCGAAAEFRVSYSTDVANRHGSRGTSRFSYAYCEEHALKFAARWGVPMPDGTVPAPPAVATTRKLPKSKKRAGAEKFAERIGKVESAMNSVRHDVQALRRSVGAEGPDRETGERLTEIEKKHFAVAETIEIMRGRLRLLEQPPLRTVEERLLDLEAQAAPRRQQHDVPRLANGTDG